MHEGNFTEEIVGNIKELLDQRTGPLPEKIRVRVGEVFHLEEMSVRMHYGILTQGTPMEKIHLELIEEPVMVECGDCRHTGTVDDHHWLVCPSCSSQNVTCVSGNDIVIDSF